MRYKKRYIFLLALIFLILAIRWNNDWLLKEDCLTAQELSALDFFGIEQSAEEITAERNASPIPQGLGPSVFYFYDSEPSELQELGFRGYFISDANIGGSIELAPEVKVNMTGDIVIRKSGVFNRFFYSRKLAIFIVVKINGEKHVASDFDINPSLQQALISSPCYEPGGAL